jgi:flagellar secretion chaperone FliS
MMSMQNPYEQYRQTQVGTANQGTLILMLYDAALKNLRLACSAIEQRKFEEANTCLIRSQEIVSELNVTLNMDAGEVAQNLRSIYVFSLTQLIQANIKKDVSMIHVVVDILSTLKEAWEEISKKTAPTPTPGGIDHGV